MSNLPGVSYEQMTDAELDAEVARRLGLKVEGPPLGFSEEVVRFPNGTWDFIPKYATDLNEAVKLPGFDGLSRFVVNGKVVFGCSWATGHNAESEQPPRAVCLAFLAAYEAKHGEVKDA